VAKKKQPDNQPEPTPVQIIRVSPNSGTQFKTDLGWWFKMDAKKAAKILDLVTAVMTDPFAGIGKPEPLKYMELDLWSRRIDLEHRLVYLVSHEEIVFFSCRYHYDGY
jgi:toxin YoeB